MKKQTVENIFSFFFITVILVMPYGAIILPFILALFTVYVFSFFCFNKSWKSRINIKVSLLPIFAIIGLISIINSNNYYGGFKVLERHISFIVLPLSFFLFANHISLSRKKVSLALLISLLICYLYSIIHFNINYSFFDIFYKSKGINHFIQLIRLIGFPIQHPSYLSFIILIGLIFISKNNYKNRYLQALIFIVILFSLIFLVLLGSRAAIISVFALLFYFMIKLLFKKRFIFFLIILGILIFSGSSVLKYTRLGNTIKNIQKSEQNYKKSDSRLIIWQNAITLIKQKPVLGYGIGDALDEMIKEHERTGFKEGVKKRLDAHNQFLETWLQSGIFGLISLILVFAFPFYQSIKKRQELLFLFLLISFIQLLFESMFIRLAGVVYFSFFYSYLYYYYYAPGGEWEQEKKAISQLTKTKEIS